MARFKITRHGVPIGTVELNPSAKDVATAAVAPEPGYEAIRPLARATGEALNASGFFGAPAHSGGSDPWDSERTSAALREGATLGRTLELHDEEDRFIPTTFIEVAEWPGVDPEVVAWVGFRTTPASVAARKPPLGGGGQAAAS